MYVSALSVAEYIDNMLLFIISIESIAQQGITSPCNSYFMGTMFQFGTERSFRLHEYAESSLADNREGELGGGGTQTYRYSCFMPYKIQYYRGREALSEIYLSSKYPDDHVHPDKQLIVDCQSCDRQYWVTSGFQCF